MYNAVRCVVADADLRLFCAGADRRGLVVADDARRRCGGETGGRCRCGAAGRLCCCLAERSDGVKMASARRASMMRVVEWSVCSAPVGSLVALARTPLSLSWVLEAGAAGARAPGCAVGHRGALRALVVRRRDARHSSEGSVAASGDLVLLGASLPGTLIGEGDVMVDGGHAARDLRSCGPPRRCSEGLALERRRADGAGLACSSLWNARRRRPSSCASSIDVSAATIVVRRDHVARRLWSIRRRGC